MRKLLLELLLIVLLGASVVFLLELFYSDYKSPVDYKILKYEKYKSELTGIIIGNSHMEILGNPKVFESDSIVINLAMGGQDLYHMLLFVEKLVPNAPKLKYVMLGLDYELIGYNFNIENQAWKDRLYYSFNRNIYDQSMSNIIMAHLNFFKANRDLSYLCCDKDTSEEAFFIPPSITKSEMECKKRALDHSLYKFKDSLFEENMDYLNKIVSVCREKKIHVILVNPPKSSCYTKFYNPEVIKIAQYNYQKFCKENRLEYLDLFISDLYQDIDFIDYDHLNAEGTKKLVLQIRNNYKTIEIE